MSLEQENKELKQQLADKTTECETLQEMVNELTAKLSAEEAKPKDENANPRVKVSGSEYEVVSGGRFRGQAYTKQEIAANKEVVAELVKMKAGIVKQINPSK